MAGLLSGLEKFGLGKLSGKDLFEDEKKKKDLMDGKGPSVKKEVTEQELLFEKTHVCPVCDKKFKALTVRTGSIKLEGTDKDLRPRYQQVDSLKYDAIVCPNCGYAGLSRFFPRMTESQIRLVMQNVSANYRADERSLVMYTYEDAIERHKLALYNAVVKKARAGEKAYICLKVAWLLRGYLEHPEQMPEDKREEMIKQFKEEENEFLSNALEGFMAARSTENFPICGMDETTLDYLMAVLATRFKQAETASKLISGILGSTNANSRMKDKTRELKEEVKEQLSAKKS